LTFFQSIGTAIFCMSVVFIVLLALWGSIVVSNVLIETFTGERSQKRSNHVS
jgi:hypothetical protein